MMLNGQKVYALRTARGWNYEETAAQVRAQGAKSVKYQHIQQLEQHPNRVPRYLLELAAAFGMTAEQFATWRGPESPSVAEGVREPAERYSSAGVDFSADIRELSLALIVLGDWIHETRPAEAPILQRALEAAAKRLGVGAESHLGLLAQAVSGHSARSRVAKKA